MGKVLREGNFGNPEQLDPHGRIVLEVTGKLQGRPGNITGRYGSAKVILPLQNL
jgi:hypothetical protein